MKKLWTFIVDFTRRCVPLAGVEFHDETLRANQGGERAPYSAWRALVGR
jgi:hypothetical protein